MLLSWEWPSNWFVYNQWHWGRCLNSLNAVSAGWVLEIHKHILAIQTQCFGLNGPSRKPKHLSFKSSLNSLDLNCSSLPQGCCKLEIDKMEAGDLYQWTKVTGEMSLRPIVDAPSLLARFRAADNGGFCFGLNGGPVGFRIDETLGYWQSKPKFNYGKGWTKKLHFLRIFNDLCMKWKTVVALL